LDFNNPCSVTEVKVFILVTTFGDNKLNTDTNTCSDADRWHGGAQKFDFREIPCYFKAIEI
jgi:hypothetical protein